MITRNKERLISQKYIEALIECEKSLDALWRNKDTDSTKIDQLMSEYDMAKKKKDDAKIKYDDMKNI